MLQRCLRQIGSMADLRQPCIYILASQRNGTLYIGVTSDLPRRLAEHRESSRPGFTAKYGITRLVRFEMFGEMERAIARETQLKNWRRAWKISLIEADNPDWHDLALGLGFAPKPLVA